MLLNMSAVCGLSILIYGVVSLPDAKSYDKFDYIAIMGQVGLS